MRRRVTILLAGSALLSPFAAAQTADPVATVAPPTAADSALPTTPEDSPGDIIVVGQGQTRQVQQLSQGDIAILPPGTSPLKAIAKLPNVNFQSADAFGAYEWSERVSIRSFNQNQIGFTLDGIPLGDGSYGNTNGLHISRAISSENIARTLVSQGAGSIGTQATNNLGGTIEFFSSDPKPQFGLTLNGTYGSENTVRAFGRLDTGVLGANGPSAYISYAYLDTRKWKGFGSQRQNQVNAKALAPLFGPVRLVATFDYSDRREEDYQDLSLDIIRRLGLRDDNITNNYPLAVLLADTGANSGYTGAPKLNPAAGTVTPTPFANVDDAYYDASGLRKDYLASVGVETAPDSAVHGALKGYYHANHGQGTWFTPYVPSPTGVPISVRTTEYDIHRKGVFGSLGGRYGFNDLTVGAWYERNDFRQARRFYALDSRIVPTRSALEFQEQPFATQWYLRYGTDTFQYYVQDKLTFDRLTVDLGWKGFSVVNTATPVVSGGLASGRIKVQDYFQPHAGLNYRLNGRFELFGDFTEVKRAFVSAATSGPFATTQAGFNALLTTNKLKPESSDTYEAGGRFHQGPVNALVAGYYVDFSNRTLAQTVGAGIVGNPAILSNVGSVRAYGVETALEAKVYRGIGVFASYSYNDSTYRNDVTVGGVVQPIRGKQTVDTPKNLAKGEITYDGTRFFGRVGADYLSRRYFTYTNDQSVPGRVLVDATIGARVELGGRRFEVQGNVSNLFDARYIATIGSNGFGYRGDNQTLLAGAPRELFVSLKTAF